jgi:hypothetical protein
MPTRNPRVNSERDKVTGRCDHSSAGYRRSHFRLALLIERPKGVQSKPAFAQGGGSTSMKPKLRERAVNSCAPIGSTFPAILAVSRVIKSRTSVLAHIRYLAYQE